MLVRERGKGEKIQIQVREANDIQATGFMSTGGRVGASKLAGG